MNKSEIIGGDAMKNKSPTDSKSIDADDEETQVHSDATIDRDETLVESKSVSDKDATQLIDKSSTDNDKTQNFETSTLDPDKTECFESMTSDPDRTISNPSGSQLVTVYLIKRMEQSQIWANQKLVTWPKI